MILQTLDAPNNVCSGAFDSQLGGDLEKTFQTFTSCYTVLCYATRVSVTPEAHILSTNVLEYVREMKKRSFGRPKALMKVSTAFSSIIVNTIRGLQRTVLEERLYFPFHCTDLGFSLFDAEFYVFFDGVIFKIDISQLFKICLFF